MCPSIALFALAANVLAGSSLAPDSSTRPSDSSTRPADSSSLPADLDSCIAKALSDWQVPGMAIAVVKDGRVVAAKGYGVRELGKPDRIDENTVFDVASLSKSFTAAAAASLVDEGKLSWDDPVRKHWPAIMFSDPYLSEEITIRDLLSHRVGLESANSLTRFTGYDRDEVFSRIRFLKEHSSFRTQVDYHNTLFALGGEAAAAAAETSWEELIRSRLLVPLGMTSSTAGEIPGRNPNTAKPHSRIDGALRPIRVVKLLNINPSAGINSTASDMARWLLFQLGDGTFEGKRILSEQSMEEMHSPQAIFPTTPALRRAHHVEFFGGYGLGWQVMDYRGHKLFWHSGNADGMPSYMSLLPEEKVGVVVLMNTWGASTLHGTVAGMVLDHFLDIESGDPSGELLERYKKALADWNEKQKKMEESRRKGTRPSQELKKYTGEYESSLFGDVHLRSGGKTLSLQMAEGEIADLTHWHYDTFRVLWRDPVFREEFSTFVTFTLDHEGTPASLRMPLGRDQIEAARVASRSQ